MNSSDGSFERRLIAALHDVQTPAGLRERMLTAVLAAPMKQAAAAPLQAGGSAAVEASGVTVGSAAVEASGVAVGSASAARPRFAHKISRRSALAFGALAASLLVGFSWWSMRTVVDPRADLATLAANWTPRISKTWQPMKGAPSSFPASSALNDAPHGWQSATNLVGSAAVAYDVSRPGIRAVLFAIRMAAPQLPFGPTGAPFSTGGQSIGTWRSGGLVYVLVVQGDERRYRSLIGSVAPPLA